MTKESDILDMQAVPSPPKSETLAVHLTLAINKGEYPVGVSLPSERELMANFGVSRSSVREALRVLGAQGLIEIKRGRNGGCYVTKPTTELIIQSLDRFIRGHHVRFVDLTYAREAIEPAAAAQAALFRTEAQLENLQALCAACENAVLDPEAFVLANLDWHLGVIEASNNPLFVAFVSSTSAALHAATDLEVFDLKVRKAVVGIHWQIFAAIRVQDSQAAHRRMLRHVAAYRDQLILANSTDG